MTSHKRTPFAIASLADRLPGSPNCAPFPRPARRALADTGDLIITTALRVSGIASIAQSCLTSRPIPERHKWRLATADVAKRP